MGAGCYYTHACNRQKACWVEVSQDDDGDEDNSSLYCWALESITGLLESNGYRNLENSFFTIKLESTYYGDGIVVELVPTCEENPCLYALAMANFDRIEERILRLIHGAGFVLKIATSGYTSDTYTPQPLKKKTK